MENLNGGTQDMFKAMVDLNDLDVIGANVLQTWHATIPVIGIRFKIHQHTMTGMKVSFFNVQGLRSDYTEKRWVRYESKQGDYHFQMNVEKTDLNQFHD